MRFDIIALTALLAAPSVLAQHQHEHGNRPGPGASSSSVAAVAEPSPKAPAAPSPKAPVAPSPNGGSKTSKDPSPAAAPNNGNNGNGASPAPTPAPATGSNTGGSNTGGNGAAGQGGPGAMTWNIVNKQGTPLSLVYGNNAGGPGPVGNPKNGMLASSTQIVFPSGWAGRVILGPNGDTAGSKIEGSVMPQFNVDVSYVDGYTVPITCTDKKAGKVFIGCNIPLFSGSAKCAQPGPGPICYNTETALHAFNGPPPAFFAPCAGAAYTFPKDDGADRVSTGAEIDCCVGAACPASVLQKGAKRGLNNVERRWAYPRHIFAEDK